MKPPVNAWSFYRLLDYEACPYRTYLKIVQKAEMPEFDEKHPIVRGRRVHEEIENYIRGGEEGMPKAAQRCVEIVEYCREAYDMGRAACEEQWGFTEHWEPTGYFDEDVWLRLVIDCAVYEDNDSAVMIDWKTGKSYGNEVKYMQQAQLYACGLFMRHPEINYVDTRFVFLDEGKERIKAFERDKKMMKLLGKFTERAKRLTSAIDFRPKPNARNCRFCPFGTENGTGACAYAVEKL